jgi:hypothetical protein
MLNKVIVGPIQDAHAGVLPSRWLIVRPHQIGYDIEIVQAFYRVVERLDHFKNEGYELVHITMEQAHDYLQKYLGYNAA